MLQSFCVYAGWADPGCQAPLRNSTLMFCAQLYSRRYYRVNFPTEGGITEPAVRYTFQHTQAAVASLTFSRSAQLPKSCSER